MKQKLNKFTNIFVTLVLVFSLCFCFTGCSPIKSMLSSIPFFEDADLDSLADKAEKAWNEVGKDALKDAATDAANTVLGNTDQIEWPNNEATSGIPRIPSGILSNVAKNNNITEITVKEVSISGYNEYIEILNQALGGPISKGIYRVENRLISIVYDEEASIITLTISIVKQNIDSSEEINQSEDASN